MSRLLDGFRPFDELCVRCGQLFTASPDHPALIVDGFCPECLADVIARTMTLNADPDIVARAKAEEE